MNLIVKCEFAGVVALDNFGLWWQYVVYPLTKEGRPSWEGVGQQCEGRMKRRARSGFVAALSEYEDDPCGRFLRPKVKVLSGFHCFKQ